MISNASDALEKLRYQQAVSIQPDGLDVPLEIHIATDESKKTFTIQVRIDNVKPLGHRQKYKKDIYSIKKKQNDVVLKGRFCLEFLGKGHWLQRQFWVLGS